MDYQRRLDISSLKQSENPIILELKVRLCCTLLVPRCTIINNNQCLIRRALLFLNIFDIFLQNLDLTKRTMVHEGPLSWRVNKDKRIGTWIHLWKGLGTDCRRLKRWLLRDKRPAEYTEAVALLYFQSSTRSSWKTFWSCCKSRMSVSSSSSTARTRPALLTPRTFSAPSSNSTPSWFVQWPLVRAWLLFETGFVYVICVDLFILCLSDNKSFFVLSMSENGAQIYKLTAQSVSDQRT